MKKLLILLFSLFLLSSPSVFADDISDFQIEGISIGDSLLDYMTEGEILEAIDDAEIYYYLNEPNKFIEIFLKKDLSMYDELSVFIKTESSNQYITNKNKKYAIQSIRGLIRYNEDFDSCIVKRNEIIEDLSQIFSDTEKTESVYDSGLEPSGDSITDKVAFNFNSGALIYLNCQDWEETFRIEKNWSDNLNIVIQTKEIVSWFNN